MSIFVGEGTADCFSINIQLGLWFDTIGAFLQLAVFMLVLKVALGTAFV